MTIIVNIGVLLLLLLAMELAAYFLIRSLGYVATQEFPEVSSELVKKFASFDSELGHLPLPNLVSTDRDITGKAYVTKCGYNSDRARCSLFEPDEPAVISTFGDSFCLCRGVEDQFTWQRRLEEQLGRPVRNYGVGGHGLDQAHLRYLQLRAKPLGRIIIFAVSPCTIERMVGIYKHYIEFGNILGLKPRYRLKEDGSLELLGLPIKSAVEIQTLSKYRKTIREWDENYNGYFRKHSAHFPFTLFFIKHKNDFLHALAKVAATFCKWPAFIRNWCVEFQETYSKITRQGWYERKNSYFESLYREHDNLFFEVVRQIGIDCNADRRQAVLLVLPDYTNISFMRKRGTYYRDVLDRINRELGTVVIDTYDIFVDTDPKLTYLKDNFAGHHTSVGNSMISDLIYSKLKPLIEDGGRELAHSVNRIQRG